MFSLITTLALRISMGSADGYQGGQGPPLSAWLRLQRVPQGVATHGLQVWPEDSGVSQQHGLAGGGQKPRVSHMGDSLEWSLQVLVLPVAL